MSGRLVALALVVAALAGCSVPGWVPWLGQGRAAKAPPRVVPPPEPPAAAVPPAPPRPAPDDSVLDRIVAVVNNDAITLGELQEAMASVRQEGRARPTADDEQLARELLNRLIDTRLQLQEAEREKITVEEAEVNEELEARMKRFGARTVQELEAMVKAQGLSMEAVRRRIRESLRIAKIVRRKVTLRVSVTDAEVDRYLAENRDKLETGLTYHARHILIVPEGQSDAAWEAARIRADLLRQQLLEGADFAELARRHSRDASARDGGDLGTLRRGELSQEIEAVILALEPGQISAPYRSPLGYHLFRLEEKEVLAGETLARARQQVREILFREKYEARLRAWLQELRARALIEVRL